MTAIKHLQAAFLPALANQPWVGEVIDLLGDAHMRSAGLVGVDIGHVDMPHAGLLGSELCIGFVSRGSRIEASCMNFKPNELAKFNRIAAIMRSSVAHSRGTHGAFREKSFQLNTLVFRTFTLAYAYDFNLPEPLRAASMRPRLILHPNAARLDPHPLSVMIQKCLNSFTTAHDDFRTLRLVAPTPSALESSFREARAGADHP